MSGGVDTPLSGILVQSNEFIESIGVMGISPSHINRADVLGFCRRQIHNRPIYVIGEARVHAQNLAGDDRILRHLTRPTHHIHNISHGVNSFGLAEVFRRSQIGRVAQFQIRQIFKDVSTSD